MATKKAAAPKRATPKSRKKEVAKAEAFIAEATEEVTKKTRAKRAVPWGHVTKEQILEARESERLSWRDVATKLELGSPSTARKAYTALTGKPHNESEVLVKRAPRGSTDVVTGKRKKAIARPEWDDFTPDEELEDSIRGRTLTIERTNGRPEEEIQVTTGMEALGKGGKKGTQQWKRVGVLVHGIRTRNGKNEKVPPYFTFIEAGTTNARTVSVEKIISVR